MLVLGFAVMLLSSCSGNGGVTPTTQDTSPTGAINAQNSHQNWGLWQFKANPQEGTMDVVQLREGNFHLNALFFLEPPPLVNLSLESLKIIGDTVDADIGLRHPFLGLIEFTGFDVCGILVTNGSVTGFNDSGLRMAGTNDTHLMNPDGYSRWWNPAEFPVNNDTMSCYKDGLLGTPQSVGHYNSTLNAYKYFCDDLGPNDPLSDIDLLKRGMFSAGTKNIRHYTIKMGPAGLVFNYAVDASWVFPTGGPPFTAPDDFPPAANRPEAWRTEVTEVENTLWNDGSGSGGGLSLSIDVYDWFNGDKNVVKVESPGNFTMATSSTPAGSGDGYLTYMIDIASATPGAGSINLLISVESNAVGYGGLLPGKTVTAYFTYSAAVSAEPPLNIYVDDSNTSGIEDGSKTYPYNTIQEGIDAAPVDYTVLVDDSGNAYVENVMMKSGIIVQSSNWDDTDGTGRALIDGVDDINTRSVHFDNVSDCSLEGFQIGYAGQVGIIPTVEMLCIDGGSGILVKDCLFTGKTDMYRVYAIIMAGSTDAEIANCLIADIDKDTASIAVTYFYGIYAAACPGLNVHNNIIKNIRPTSDSADKNFYSIEISDSTGITVKNNLVYNIVPHATGNVIFQYVVYISNCTNPIVANNTVHNINSNDAFLNEAFVYFLEDTSGITFTNNIATTIYANGFPPPMARGVEGVNLPVTCDFCDTYDIGPGSFYGADYYGTATPGTGPIYDDPLYIDPDNGDFEISASSPAQQGDPSFVDWDDTGSPSNDPLNTDTNTRSRIGCHGGPGGELIGLLS